MNIHTVTTRTCFVIIQKTWYEHSHCHHKDLFCYHTENMILTFTQPPQGPVLLSYIKHDINIHTATIRTCFVIIQKTWYEHSHCHHKDLFCYHIENMILTFTPHHKDLFCYHAETMILTFVLPPQGHVLLSYRKHDINIHTATTRTCFVIIQKTWYEHSYYHDKDLFCYHAENMIWTFTLPRQEPVLLSYWKHDINIHNATTRTCFVIILSYCR